MLLNNKDTCILFSVILVFAFSCVQNYKIEKTLNRLDTPLAANIEFSSMIQGYCTTTIKGKSLKAGMIASIDSGCINASLVDELGTQLATITSNDSDFTILRYFPPLNKRYAKIVGTGITSVVKSLTFQSPHGIFNQKQNKNLQTVYFFSHGNIDSIVVTQKEKYLYTLYKTSNIFNLVNSRRDTVCSCYWNITD